MAKLILSLDGSIIKEIPLDKERLTIGRKAHNDLQIDNLAVSGEHALIVTILNDSFLEDLGSTNGTLVNGQPIKKHILQNNDVVEIGKYKLKYAQDATAAAPGAPGPADFEKTMVISRPAAAAARAEAAAAAQAPAAATAAHVAPPAPSPAPPPPQTAPVVPPPAAAAPPRPAAPPSPPPTSTGTPAAPAAGSPLGSIQILSGPSTGKELDLVKNLTTLGKPGVQVAVITRRPQGYFITHVEGAHFPIINGKVLDAQAHPLVDHDVVELAGVKMEFFYKNK